MTPDEVQLPRLPAALLRRLLPYAERDEVLGDLAAEHRVRVQSSGRIAASGWVWRQVLASVPALARRGWWRGWSGFEPQANRYRPGGGMFENGVKDIKFSLRRLQRRPTYTALTVLTLALGVAGTAAVFGIAKRLLLEPLPYRAEEEVAIFWNQGDWRESEFLYLRPEMEGFRSVAAYRSADATLQRGDAPARLVEGISASAELFQVLGVSPALGPGFRPGDDAMGAEPVVVLGHSLWRELGADPAIVGQRIELAGVPRTVVGVMPEGFWFPSPTVQAWLAEEMDPENNVGNYILIGRMNPGARIEGMAGPLERITTLLGERFTYPEQWDKTRNAELTPLREFLVGSVRPALLAMLAAMAVILLIACVNVAALMLGQVDARGTELAVRSALGAGRHRLLRQLVVEALVIGALAGLIGAALALAGFRFLRAALPLGALAETARVDWTLFGAAIAIALVAATVVALVPGISVARSDLQKRLTRTRTGGIAGRGGRLESALVVAQVALVLLMAAGAGLLIRSVGNLRAIDTGLETQGVAVVDVTMPVTTEMARRPQLLRELVGAVEALPGVQSAAAAQTLPLRGGGNNWGIGIQGRPDLEQGVTTFVRLVTPDYFQTMGIRVRSGRGLLESDGLATDEGVVVINQALAERFFPGTDPIGQRIGTIPNRWDRVVGVVENVAEGGLTDAPEPARYLLFQGVGLILPGQTIVIRTQSGRDPATVLDAARRALQATAPGVAVRELTTMENVLNRAIGPARQVMSLLTLLSTLALVLGVIGVYGVVSHFVTRRKRDWGIRIALGMRPPRVVRKIVAQGGALVGTGIVLGLVGFLALARLLASLLYGVGTADPLALGGATEILLAAGLLAAYFPARRASRIDPALVLREQ
ncbi:MAG: ADOP family duplicated permease [Gemmatimonadota bacterium]|nr:ADOP family duplicated permease [Gemmatimonadota bacterium]